MYMNLYVHFMFCFVNKLFNCFLHLVCSIRSSISVDVACYVLCPLFPQ
uniref:Uncharacterized protein n=1 Tax=Anguilla anguilla TaxID=7936 RepID=A0A0E9P9I1_ANGAN